MKQRDQRRAIRVKIKEVVEIARLRRFCCNWVLVYVSTKSLRSDNRKHVENYVEKEELTEEWHRKILCCLHDNLEVFQFTKHLNDTEIAKLEDSIDPSEPSVYRYISYQREIDNVWDPVSQLKYEF